MFDWTKIEGYREDMTSDEKIALLEKYDPAAQGEPKNEPAPAKSEPAPASAPANPIAMKGFVPKAQLDKVSSELAATKKQLKARMTEDEQREADRQAEQEAIKTELETLRRDKTVSSYKASCLALNYDEALADEMAVAMADGDMETVFESMKKHGLNMEKNLRAKILKETPVPPAGNDPNKDAKKLKEMADLRASFGLPPL